MFETVRPLLHDDATELPQRTLQPQFEARHQRGQYCQTSAGG
jgi:hypothetical protein